MNKKLLGIELTDIEFDTLLCEQSNGKELKVENGKVVAYIREATTEQLNHKRIAEIKAQLTELNFDLLQDQAGLLVPNLNEKKQQFIELHNELRTLLGKETREVK